MEACYKLKSDAHMGFLNIIRTILLGCGYKTVIVTDKTRYLQERKSDPF
jgi:hypothetical protein